jgi:hypothetical protein
MSHSPSARPSTISCTHCKASPTTTTPPSARARAGGTSGRQRRCIDSRCCVEEPRWCCVEWRRLCGRAHGWGCVAARLILPPMRSRQQNHWRAVTRTVAVTDGRTSAAARFACENGGSCACCAAATAARAAARWLELRREPSAMAARVAALNLKFLLEGSARFSAMAVCDAAILLRLFVEGSAPFFPCVASARRVGDKIYRPLPAARLTTHTAVSSPQGALVSSHDRLSSTPAAASPRCHALTNPHSLALQGTAVRDDGFFWWAGRTVGGSAHARASRCASCGA